jgi:VWFA-related protein
VRSTSPSCPLDLRTLSAVAIAGGLFLFSASAARAAAPPTPPAPPAPPISADASAEISVTAVEIPVEVMRRGKPVEGLTAADFEVLADGQPLPVTSCEVIELRGAPTPAAGAAVNEAAPVPAASEPPPVARRHLMLLFDASLTSPDRLAEGVSAARRMVAGSLDPSDLVGVGVFLPRGDLALLVPFTGDRAAVDLTLEALFDALTGKRPVRTADGKDPLRGLGVDARSLRAQRFQTREGNNAAQLMADYGDQVSEVLGGAAAEEESAVETREREHVMAMVDSLGRLADYLRPVDGRKYLALFSAGFSDRLVNRPTQGIGDPNLGGATLIANLDTVLTSLAHLGWVIHAANLATTRGGGLNGDGLFILADKTGGTLIEGGNDLAPGLGRAMSRSAYSYLLTIQVDVPPDGGFHSLDVRLRRPESGLAIHHRGGYFAPKKKE